MFSTTLQGIWLGLRFPGRSGGIRNALERHLGEVHVEQLLNDYRGRKVISQG